MTRRHLLTLGAVAIAALSIAGCSRSGPSASSVTPNTGSAQAPATPGVFGSLGRVCGPGHATGKSSRGVTNGTITVGTTSDEGSEVVPGLNHEFFDASQAFVRWCNRAGGIAGRRLVLNKHDAAMFGAAQQTIAACQTDFMEVGGGFVIDEPSVAPRLKCGLADVPVFEISNQAIDAPLQVAPGISSPTIQLAGAYRLLAARFPNAVKHLGIGAPAVPAFITQARQYVQAAEVEGYKLADFQEAPATVDNWQPYIQRSQSAGVQVLQPTATGDLMEAYVRAMNNAGWSPKAQLLGYYNYLPQVIDAAKATKFPPTWVGISIWPLELASENPATETAVQMMKASLPNAPVDSSDIQSIGAWLLWARSAAECGSHLTGKCVIQQAQHYTGWTAGGLYAPVNLKARQPSDCVTMLRATPQGWKVDKSLTQPNYRGIFNCSSKNLVHLGNSG